MSLQISKTAIIRPGVVLGNGTIIEDFAAIGVISPEVEGLKMETVIGKKSLIRMHTVIYSGNKIGNNFMTGNKVNIRENNVIGDNVSIGTLSVIEHHVTIGNDVRIHSQSFIPEYSILENGCWIGPNVVLTNSKYPVSRNSKANLEGVHICEKAIIGANATLLPGITIGKYAIVGAGSVVTEEIEEATVVAGNPARKINSTHNLPYDIPTPVVNENL